jgi:hypothetical protein
MFTTALLLAASLFGAAPTADLAVDLKAQGTYLLPGARYDVTITNHGPEPLASATVVVTLQYQTWLSTTEPCVHDSAAYAITCTFGPLAAGATATLSRTVYYSGIPLDTPSRPTPVDATATRTASIPADPNPANDADTKRCWYWGPAGIPPSTIPPLTC